ncbi:MAG: HTTM domain-containing protein [Gemmatimonadales bacterium]
MSNRSATLAASWNRFWFRPESAWNLAAARIVFGVHALWILLSRDLAGISASPPEFWASVPRAALWRFLIFPGHLSFEHVLQWLTMVLLVGVVLGIHPRITCLMSALLLYHLAPYENIMWYPGPTERGFEVSVLSLVTLAFAPCTDVWALRVPTRGRVGTRSWHYNWPLCVMQLFVAQIYLFAGYAKLFHVGLGWISGDTIRNLILAYDQAFQTVSVRPLGPWIAERPMLCFAIALGAVAMDLVFVVAVFSKRSRIVMIPAAIAFHIGILLTTTIYFLNWPQLLIFVNWDWVRHRMHRSPATAQPPALETVLL